MMGFEIGNSGINNNGIDSSKGKMTTYGIRKYQRWAGLKVNGEIDESLMNHMENSLSNGVNISQIYEGMVMFDAPNSNFRVTSYFGPRVAPTKGASTVHNGLDLGAVVPGEAGDDVLSSINGEVTEIGSTNARGNYIIVSADYGSDTYAIRVQHLMDGSTNVAVGDQVNVNTVLASMGNSGIGSAVHLHYEIELNGNYVDPLDYLKYPRER